MPRLATSRTAYSRYWLTLRDAVQVRTLQHELEKTSTTMGVVPRSPFEPKFESAPGSHASSEEHRLRAQV